MALTDRRQSTAIHHCVDLYSDTKNQIMTSAVVTTPAESRLRAIATQLVKTIDHHRDNKTDELHQMQQQWMEELTLSASFTTHESKEIVRQALDMLTKVSISNTSVTPAAASSVSLWDQFQTSSFSERVMWSDIEQAIKDDAAAMEPAKILILLQKVDHIDDLLGGDWSEACGALQKGLMLPPQSSSGETLTAYIELHVKWFKECQATAEYQSIRFDLCHNVWQAASRLLDWYRSEGVATTADDEILFDLLQTWKSMWIQIMTSAGSDSDERVDEVVQQVFGKIANQQQVGTSWQQQPINWFALADPTAVWFQCWLDDTPILRILTVVGVPPSRSIVAVLLERYDSGQGPIGTIGAEQKLIESKVRSYSLAILTALVLQLRVRMFPWDQVKVPGSLVGDDEPNKQQVDEREVMEQPNQTTNESEWFKEFPKPHSANQVLTVARAICGWRQENIGEVGLISQQCGLALDALLSGCQDDARLCTELTDMIGSITNSSSI